MIQNQQENKAQTKYCWIHRGLYTLVILLLVIVLVIPGALRLLYRADAQVALGHAKSVRLALQMIGKESYGKNGTFCDASHEGGVTDDIWKDVMNLSKAPGDFWVLQTAGDGYTVKQFVYKEDEFTVWFQDDPKSYTVYHDDLMIDSGKDTGE